MMTFVLVIVISLILVTLEHAYVNAGGVIASNALDRQVSGILGDFYAPLYTQYGIFAVPYGEGFYFEEVDDIADEISELITLSYQRERNEEASGFLWNYDVEYLGVKSYANLRNEDYYFLNEQIKTAATMDSVVAMADVVSKVLSEDGANISTLWDSVLANGSTNGFDGIDKADSSIHKGMISDLQRLITEGVTGAWLIPGEISDKKIDSTLLSSEDDPEVHSSEELFSRPDLEEYDYTEDSIIEELISADFVTEIQNAFSDSTEYTTDKISLAAYSFLNFDNYVQNNIDGELDYEQEYLIFGSYSDERNIELCARTIFTVRLVMGLIYYLTNPVATEELSAWAASYGFTGEWAALALVLAGILLAIENAAVETNAILRGKAVDFTASAMNRSISLAEIFRATPTFVNEKARSYIGRQGVKVNYQMYLLVFFLLAQNDHLLVRIGDIIEVNMKRNYNESFNLDKCIVGISVEAKLENNRKYIDLPFYVGKNGGRNIYRVSTAAKFN